MEDERRRTPRYPFIATAEILEKGAQTGVTAQVSELSLYGCYVEISNPLPKGTEARFKIYADGKYFETQGIVIYSQADSGMGVGFQNVNPHYLTVLKQWLIEAAQAKFGKKE